MMMMLTITAKSLVEDRDTKEEKIYSGGNIVR
jgi:hypothetical protein